jgi:hypothetical protein
VSLIQPIAGISAQELATQPPALFPKMIDLAGELEHRPFGDVATSRAHEAAPATWILVPIRCEAVAAASGRCLAHLVELHCLLPAQLTEPSGAAGPQGREAGKDVLVPEKGEEENSGAGDSR